MADRPGNRIVAICLAAGLTGCAVPVAPSGGPVDSTPPSLVSSEPESGSVRVAPERVRLLFDEYVDQRAAATAVTVTPAPAEPPEIHYGGREIEVRFRAPLRDSTTYIVTLDTQFRDAHGVQLKAPVTIAFSTGDRIDTGRLTGRVIAADTGRPETSADVFAYATRDGAAPDSLNLEPTYRTQTDNDGRFRLEHLAERPFFVVVTRDANRNRRADPDEPLAVPPEASLTADTTGTEPDRPWILSDRDSTPPEVRRGAGRSSSRIELFFSENVRLVRHDPDAWRVADSSGTRSLEVRLVDIVPDDPRSVVVRTDPMPEGWWLVQADSTVADSSGNILATLTIPVLASASIDTVRARFRSFTGDTLGTDSHGNRILAPWARAGFRLSDPRRTDSLRARVAVEDTTGRSVDFELRASPAARFDVEPALDDSPFRLSIRPEASDSVYGARFVRAGPDRLGELSGVVRPADGRIVVELLPQGSSSEPVRRVRPDTSGIFVFDRLPGGHRYRLRVFADRNGDGAWSRGRLVPFAPAERLGWFDTVPPVRARWETALTDTVRIGNGDGRVSPAPGENRR